MKKFILLIGVMALFAVASCSDEQLIESSSNSELKSTNDICGEAKVVDLIAGQHLNVGSVSVSNDEEYLYVTYQTSGNWYLTETHVYVGKESNIPLNGGGNPKIGHFPYSKTHDELTSYTYSIELADLDDCFAVVTHAVVEKIENGRTVQGETAFGCGDKEFPGRRWGCYFDYCKQDCEDDCLEIYGKKYRDEFSECLNPGESQAAGSYWTNWLPYVILFDGNRHDLDLFADDNNCDTSGLSQVAQIQILNNTSSDTELNVKYIISNPAYQMSSLSLYLGTEKNPYDENGDLKPGVSASDFYTKDFDTPVSEYEFTVEWTGDQNPSLLNYIYYIGSIKVCN